jgi:hypothetical protein
MPGDIISESVDGIFARNPHADATDPEKVEATFYRRAHLVAGATVKDKKVIRIFRVESRS